MFTDIVLPNGNEKEFVEMANKLGLSGLCFAYEYSSKLNFREKKKQIAVLAKKSKINLSACFIAMPKQIQAAKKHSKIIITKSSGNDREVIEKQRPSIIFGMESIAPRDSMHQRNSGLNHILCRLAKEKKVAVGFSFSEILNSEKPKRTQIIGRMMQNIRLCRKYKNKTIIATFAENPFQLRQAHDLTAFFTVIGMHQKEAKDALEAVSKSISTENF